MINVDDLSIKFANYLDKECKEYLIEDDIEGLLKNILSTDSLIKDPLVAEYKNLSIWLIYFFKNYLNIDLADQPNAFNYLNKWSDKLTWKEKETIQSNDNIRYDEIEFDNDWMRLAEYFEADKCVLKGQVNDPNVWRIYLEGVICKELNVDVDFSKLKVVFGRYTIIDNLILSDDIDPKLITPTIFDYGSKIGKVTYKGKLYSFTGFLNFCKNERKKVIDKSKYSELYVVRDVRGHGYFSYLKKFYNYLYVRKIKKSGKYRFNWLSDMGGERCSVAYFKSREHALDVLTKNNWRAFNSDITKARIKIDDVERGFREVELENGGKVLIKNGSPGDIYEDLNMDEDLDINESMTADEIKVQRKICLYLREDGFPRFADYLENFHINLVTSRDMGGRFVAAIDPGRGVVYLNPTIDVMALSVLLRHEIGHAVFKHNEHMFAKLKKLGITKPSALAYRLANICGDYHISNKIYDDADKALVKGVNKKLNDNDIPLKAIVVENEEAIGLVTEFDFPENPEYWDMDFDQLWDVFVQKYDVNELNADYVPPKPELPELAPDYIEGWNELIDAFNKKEITEKDLQEILKALE